MHRDTGKGLKVRVGGNGGEEEIVVECDHSGMINIANMIQKVGDDNVIHLPTTG